MEKLLNENKNNEKYNDKKKRKNKTKRGKKSKKERFVNIFSTNAAQLKGKINSFKNELKETNAAVFTVQETHCRRKGRIQMDTMVVFEAIRSKKGGGTLCAVHQDLNPKLVEEYNEPF